MEIFRKQPMPERSPGFSTIHEVTDLEYFKSLFNSCDYTELEYNDGVIELELDNFVILSFDKNGKFKCLYTGKLIDDIQSFLGFGRYPGIDRIERIKDD